MGRFFIDQNERAASHSRTARILDLGLDCPRCEAGLTPIRLGGWRCESGHAFASERLVLAALAYPRPPSLQGGRERSGTVPAISPSLEGRA
jgi:hypothetical protein